VTLNSTIIFIHLFKKINPKFNFEVIACLITYINLVHAHSTENYKLPFFFFFFRLFDSSVGQTNKVPHFLNNFIYIFINLDVGQSSNGPSGSVLFTVTVELKVPTFFLLFFLEKKVVVAAVGKK
jgi:hypothetical protein